VSAIWGTSIGKLVEVVSVSEIVMLRGMFIYRIDVLGCRMWCETIMF